MGRSNKGKHFLDHSRLEETSNTENFRLLTESNPKINTLSGLGTESSPDLGVSLSSTVGQIGH